ncbi:hypothetical protein CLOM_g21552 [Closterium sp. NIES-68]|nr:hypothetical protein CLOM_g21552 [Closterium sp. NIES-68]GJP70544.1 hypothetical protein CLOP_g1473 [Closterium sp. NIES-67]
MDEIACDALTSPANRLTDDHLRLVFRFLASRADPLNHARYYAPSTAAPQRSASFGDSASLNHAVVCKRWRRLALLELSSVTVTSGSATSSRRLMRSLSRYPSLTRLHLERESLDFIDDAFIEAIGRHCSKLVTLSLYAIEEAACSGQRGQRSQLCLTRQTGDEHREDQRNHLPGITEQAVDVLFRSCTRLEHLLLHCAQYINSIPPSISTLTRLETLDVSSMSLTRLPEVMSESLTSLQVLRILAPSLEFLPVNIGHLKNLREMRVCCQTLQCLPPLFAQLGSLELIHITGCQNLFQLPDSFCDLHTLTWLQIEDCGHLSSLPPSLHCLTSLTHFHLSSLPSLTALPPSTVHLPNLQSLGLCLSDSFHVLPPSFRLLSSLTRLDISCPGMDSLPEDIGLLLELKILKIHSMEGLVSLPVSLGQLENLQQLTVTRCPKLKFLSLPCPDATAMPSPPPLPIPSSPALSPLPSLLSLHHISIRHCPCLSSLPQGLSRLSSLRSLVLVTCPRLKELPDGLAHLSTLHSLVIVNCQLITQLPEGLCLLPQLQRIVLRYSDSLYSHSEGGEGLAMRNVDEGAEGVGVKGMEEEEGEVVGECAEEEEEEKEEEGEEQEEEGEEEGAPGAQWMGGKETDIAVHPFTSPTSPPYPSASSTPLPPPPPFPFRLPDQTSRLHSLTSLKVIGFPGLFRVPESLGLLNSLRRLTLQGCCSIHLPASVSALCRLQHLEVSGMGSLKLLPDDLGQLPELKTLHLANLPSLERLPEGIGQLKKAIVVVLPVVVNGNQAILPPMAPFPSLQSLTLQGSYPWGEITAGPVTQPLNRACDSSAFISFPDAVFSALSSHGTLHLLHFDLCRNLTQLPSSLTSLSSLHHLSLSNLPHLASLPSSLHLLSSLHSLTLDTCPAIASLPPSLALLPSLKTLSIRRCKSLKSLPESTAPYFPSLQALLLHFLPSLEELPSSLTQIPLIERLSIVCCSSLAALPDDIGRLSRSLRRIEIRECWRLKANKLPDSLWVIMRVDIS